MASTRKRARKMKGGKFIKTGSTGCGYFPALRCVGETERPPGIFSKLMKRADALKEFAQIRPFAALDPSQKYFLYPIRLCDVNQDVLPNPENDIQTCGLISNLQTASILQLRYGGEDLSKLNILNPEEYIPFFEAIQQLFEGLLLIHSNNLVHLDVKIPNIVYQKDTPTSFQLRFIDFGLYS